MGVPEHMLCSEADLRRVMREHLAPTTALNGTERFWLGGRLATWEEDGHAFVSDLSTWIFGFAGLGVSVEQLQEHQVAEAFEAMHFVNTGGGVRNPVFLPETSRSLADVAETWRRLR